MNWTNNQLDAIYKSDTNIQVSAGAGSGKTAVLSTRVIEILKKGININNLLILTFTKDAASEMKDRIRKKILKDESLYNQLDLLDNAYITTFDSYALSIVKKYGYKLNISNKVSVINDYIMGPLKKKYIDEIFEDLYNNHDVLFENYLKTYTLKDDTEFKQIIFNFLNFIEKINDKDKYLDNYIDKYYSETFINNCINEYKTMIFDKIKRIKSLLINNDLNDNEYTYLSIILNPLINCTDYNELTNISITFKRALPNDTIEYKETKSTINNLYKEIKELSTVNLNDIKKNILSTKDTAQLIINITRKLYNKLYEYQLENEKFTFSNIASLAFKLVNENDEIKKEIKNSFYEIMIDEYQDTSDVQEDFINLIENNNVYCVGDIKQSIYRFRNANPDLFKNKYEKYSKNIGGYKIDLVENFRSREEVLDSINDIFNNVMDIDIGGADYKNYHQMKYGNKMYELKANQDYGLKVLNYEETNNKELTEAFIIGNKIKELFKNKYKILDNNNLRDIKYSDITILMDRGSSFNTYKKVFEYLNIPLVLHYDELLTTETDILVLKNIMGLIIKISNKCYDEDFRHYYISVSRSFVIDLDDDIIFEQLKNNYKESELFIKCKKISDEIDDLNIKELLNKIIEDFNFYEKVITIGKIKESIIKIDSILSIADELSTLGYNNEEFIEVLEKIISDKNQDIKYSSPKLSNNCVNILNIHKSKGLEYPICFFSGFYKKFNIDDIKSKYLFTNKYGMILPYYNQGLGNTIIRQLYLNDYLKENISERIRLLYVALTRVKEMMYIVCPIEKNNIDKLDYNSFKSIMDSIDISKYIENVDVNKLNITDELEVKNTYDIEKSNKKIINKSININSNIIDKTHASKQINKVIDKSDYDLLKYGTYMHEIFETTDFINTNANTDEHVINLLKKLGDLTNTKICKELEFVNNVNDTIYHGIIDLLIEYPNSISIIDYKLKNIDDDNYKKQLKIYKDYIKTKTDKEINTYLYSIINDKLKVIK